MTEGAWRRRAAALGDRWEARLAARAAVPGGALHLPEPRRSGDPARGRALLDGRLRVDGVAVALEGRAFWDVAGADAQGWGWLHDLAAVGDRAARGVAQGWARDWLRRFGAGAGPGWTPAPAADRTLALVAWGRWLMRGREGVPEPVLRGAIARHARFLRRRGRAAPDGRARIAGGAALVAAGLALGDRALAAEGGGRLGRDADRLVDATGAIPSRNPEELMEVALLLGDAREALAGAGLAPSPLLAAAVARAAPVLRALRHADGGLPRFHGGEAGGEGRLEEALAAAGRRPLAAGARKGLAMGFLRLAAGRTTVIVDAAAPPGGTDAHASTLAFEMASGRRALVVCCGPGGAFGPDWRRAARATPSHSTLALAGLSSARLAPAGPGGGGPLVDAPARVIAEVTPLTAGLRAELAHDGWRPSHGLTHARTLQLSADGAALGGEDLLTTLTAADGLRLDRALGRDGGLGIPFAVRFHLHPDTEPELMDDGTAVVSLPSGEAWAFRHDGAGALGLEPSVVLDPAYARPRPTLQLVLSARLRGRQVRLRWTLAKAPGTPRALRDLRGRTGAEGEKP